jgi:hypothetical protein
MTLIASASADVADGIAELRRRLGAGSAWERFS